MADARTFLLADASGAPLTTATPVFVDYRDRTGTARTPPANPLHVGGGLYVFTPSDADESTGTVVLVDAGVGAEPRRTAWAIHLANNSNQFWAWHVEDAAGALWAGAAPTVGMYRDVVGASRTPPAILPTAGAYLYSLLPSAADVSADTSLRIDQPAGASVPYLTGDTMPVSTSGGGGGSLTPSPGLSPEGIAVLFLMEWLRLWLPPKVVELNTLRPAVLKTPGFGTGSSLGWVIAPGQKLKISTSRDPTTGTLVTLPSGANVLASAIATAVNATPVPGITASADSLGRLLLTSNTPPVAPATNSLVVLHPEATNGAKALGWEAGGEVAMMAPLLPPAYRGIMDGRPVMGPDANAGMWVILGERTSRAYPSPGAELRRGETETTITLEIFRAEMNLSPSHNREAINSSVRAVREVLEYGEGRYLGRAGAGDVTRVFIGQTDVGDRPFNFTDLNTPNVFHDVATMSVIVRTFQRTQ